MVVGNDFLMGGGAAQWKDANPGFCLKKREKQGTEMEKEETEKLRD